jgi:uncharacterized protein (DUF952 family)
MRILHLALRSDWEAARTAGTAYAVSTLGRTLAEEGFVHASRGDQWQGVRDRFYADVSEPLVLLVVDTDLLTSPVVEEVPEGGEESFPHVYGPIDLAAVVQVVPLDAAGRPSGNSFSALFLREVFRNALLGSLVLALVVCGALAGRALEPRWGALTGALVALGVGVSALVALRSRR